MKGTVGKATCCQAWFSPWSPDAGRKEESTDLLSALYCDKQTVPQTPSSQRICIEIVTTLSVRKGKTCLYSHLLLYNEQPN